MKRLDPVGASYTCCLLPRSTGCPGFASTWVHGCHRSTLCIGREIACILLSRDRGKSRAYRGRPKALYGVPRP